MNSTGIKPRRHRLRVALRSGHPGQAMAEFALVLTPCLALFFGIINFALALYCYDFVCYSAQQAVRYATVRGSTAPSPVSAAQVQSYVDTLVVGCIEDKFDDGHDDLVAQQQSRKRGYRGCDLQIPAADEPGFVGHDPAHPHRGDGDHAVALSPPRRADRSGLARRLPVLPRFR